MANFKIRSIPKWPVWTFTNRFVTRQWSALSRIHRNLMVLWQNTQFNASGLRKIRDNCMKTISEQIQSKRKMMFILCNSIRRPNMIIRLMTSWQKMFKPRSKCWPILNRVRTSSLSSLVPIRKCSKRVGSPALKSSEMGLTISSTQSARLNPGVKSTRVRTKYPTLSSLTNMTSETSMGMISLGLWELRDSAVVATRWLSSKQLKQGWNWSMETLINSYLHCHPSFS